MLIKLLYPLPRMCPDLALGEPFTRSIGSSLFVQQTVYLLSAALMVLGLVGLYAFQREESGSFGIVGFLLAFLGTMLFAGAVWALLFIGPLVATEAPQLLQGQPPASVAFRFAVMGFLISYGLFALGWLLFGVAMLRTHLLPRLAALLLIGTVLTHSPFSAPHGRRLLRSRCMAGFGSLDGQGWMSPASSVCKLNLGESFIHGLCTARRFWRRLLDRQVSRPPEVQRVGREAAEALHQL
jgi:hypothetical protein